jgi:hypothetical protein
VFKYLEVLIGEGVAELSTLFPESLPTNLVSKGSEMEIPQESTGRAKNFEGVLWKIAVGIGRKENHCIMYER